MVHSKGRGDAERLMKVPLMTVATGGKETDRDEAAPRQGLAADLESARTESAES